MIDYDKLNWGKKLKIGDYVLNDLGEKRKIKTKIRLMRARIPYWVNSLIFFPAIPLSISDKIYDLAGKICGEELCDIGLIFEEDGVKLSICHCEPLND